ncbi:MAG: formyltransferase family protein [Burkholderiaceae bacterium]
MKLLLCTKRDLVGNIMLNRLLPLLTPQHQVEVLLANRIRPETDSVAELGWMKFFEQDLPNRLLFPLIDHLDPATAGATQWLSFGALAQRHGVRIEDAGHIPNATELTRRVREAAPELIVSFQFGFIFKPEALAVPARGALNLHSGALPARAGVNPTFWCMKDGDRDAACTLHWIDAGIDSGPLVEVRPLPLDYSRSLFSNWIANYENGARLIADAVATLAAGNRLPALEQDAGSRRYVPKPSAADFADFAARGRRLIDGADYLELLGRYLPA